MFHILTSDAINCGHDSEVCKESVEIDYVACVASGDGNVACVLSCNCECELAFDQCQCESGCPGYCPCPAYDCLTETGLVVNTVVKRNPRLRRWTLFYRSTWNRSRLVMLVDVAQSNAHLGGITKKLPLRSLYVCWMSKPGPNLQSHKKRSFNWATDCIGDNVAKTASISFLDIAQFYSSVEALQMAHKCLGAVPITTTSPLTLWF